MAGRLRNNGTDLDSIFQLYVAGDKSQATTTNIQNGGTDIKSRYAGRDNRAGNAASATNYKYNVGGTPTDISGLFNKTGAAFDVTIGGTVTYNGAGQTASISSYSPTDVSAPSISGTVTNTGSYGTGSFTIGLPGNYAAGTYGGTFTINRKTVTGLNATYGYDTIAQFWIIYDCTISGGVASAPFDNFTINVFTNTVSSGSDFPVTFSGVFNGSGNYTITFSPAKVCFPNVPGNGALRLSTGSSTNYTGSPSVTLFV